MALGRQLRHLRETADVSLKDAASVLRVTPLTVRRMENAEVGFKPLYVRELLIRYGRSQDEITQLMDLVEEANRPGWWHQFRDVLPPEFSVYVSLETDAELIRTYAPTHVPDLLQTPDYARAAVRVTHPGASGDEVDRHVDLRLRRQEILARDTPPSIWVLMDEAVLRRTVTDRKVMDGQIRRLLEASDMPNMTIQILPFDAGLVPGTAGFHYFRFQADIPDVVYVNLLTSAVYLDDRQHVVAYLELLDRMSVKAASADDTRTILTNLLD
jgi:transcriptional regulator with XRE-family HTH domain